MRSVSIRWHFRSCKFTQIIFVHCKRLGSEICSFALCLSSLNSPKRAVSKMNQSMKTVRGYISSTLFIVLSSSVSYRLHERGVIDICDRLQNMQLKFDLRAWTDYCSYIQLFTRKQTKVFSLRNIQLHICLLKRFPFSFFAAVTNCNKYYGLIN